MSFRAAGLFRRTRDPEESGRAVMESAVVDQPPREQVPLAYGRREEGTGLAQRRADVVVADPSVTVRERQGRAWLPPRCGSLRPSRRVGLPSLDFGDRGARAPRPGGRV